MNRLPSRICCPVEQKSGKVAEWQGMICHPATLPPCHPYKSSSIFYQIYTNSPYLRGKLEPYSRRVLEMLGKRFYYFGNKEKSMKNKWIRWGVGVAALVLVTGLSLGAVMTAQAQDAWFGFGQVASVGQSVAQRGFGAGGPR